MGWAAGAWGRRRGTWLLGPRFCPAFSTSPLLLKAENTGGELSGVKWGLQRALRDKEAGEGSRMGLLTTPERPGPRRRC